MPKHIPLTRGRFAIVDDEWFDKLSKHHWYCSNYGYAYRRGPGGRKGSTLLSMHRTVLGLDNTGCTSQIDHIDGNPLNNTVANLRVCSPSQNLHNRDKQKNNKSGFKGVYWATQVGRWLANITVNGKRHHLGTFFSPAEAAKAYDVAARELLGEFARLNFPD